MTGGGKTLKAAQKPERRSAAPVQKKAAMGRPYGLNHVSIGPAETGLEAQAEQTGQRAVRGERNLIGALSPAPPAAVAVPSTGRALPAPERAWLEPAFGADLAAVRVHHGAEAATAARAEHAEAFTAGRDIYFGEDRFAPQTHEGRRLIAHEVAHVLQQTAVSDGGHGAREASGPGEPQRQLRERRR